MKKNSLEEKLSQYIMVGPGGRIGGVNSLLKENMYFVTASELERVIREEVERARKARNK